MTGTGLVEHSAQCDCPMRESGIHDFTCQTIEQYMDKTHDARDRADYEEMSRDDAMWEKLRERERALEDKNDELRALLDTAVGANAMWKRLHDEKEAALVKAVTLLNAIDDCDAITIDRDFPSVDVAIAEALWDHMHRVIGEHQAMLKP